MTSSKKPGFRLSGIPVDWSSSLSSNTSTLRRSPKRSLSASLLYSPTEDQIQETCINWFRAQYPGLAHLLFAIPNGARTSMSVAKRLKRTGLMKGIPDLMLAHPRGGYHGLFIEMKTPTNYPEPHQREKIAQLKAEGYFVEVCKSLEAFMAVVRSYLGVDRA